MTLLVRFITGAAVGFELTPSDGVYLVVYLGIIEIAFCNEKEMDL